MARRCGGHSRTCEYQSMDMTWLAWHPRLLDFLTHVSVLWEVSFCALIWRATACGRSYSPMAVALHVGIGACLGHVDVRADHAGRLCVVLTRRGGEPARGRLDSAPGPVNTGREFVLGDHRGGRLSEWPA